jgi:hypothetical protein
MKRIKPWILKPYQYHNHTFWPWTKVIEMLARSRFNKAEGCNTLLSRLASNDSHPHLHDSMKINSVTDQVSEAYQFRTGIG